MMTMVDSLSANFSVYSYGRHPLRLAKRMWRVSFLFISGFLVCLAGLLVGFVVVGGVGFHEGVE